MLDWIYLSIIALTEIQEDAITANEISALTIINETDNIHKIDPVSNTNSELTNTTSNEKEEPSYFDIILGQVAEIIIIRFWEFIVSFIENIKSSAITISTVSDNINSTPISNANTISFSNNPSENDTTVSLILETVNQPNPDDILDRHSIYGKAYNGVKLYNNNEIFEIICCFE